MLLHRQPALQGASNDLFQRRLHHLRKFPVGPQNGAISRQRKGPFAHLLQQHAVRVLGPLHGEDLLAQRTGHHQGVDGAGPDRLQHLLGLLQAGAQLLIFILEALELRGVHVSSPGRVSG